MENQRQEIHHQKIVFNTSIKEITKRIKNIDLVCTDLDECLFPFYTQVLVVGEIILDSLFKRHMWRHLPRLIGGSLFVCLLIVISFGRVKVFKNEFLMKVFAWTVMGVSVLDIRKHSQYIHNFFYAESLTLLKRFADHNIPITILSLSIQPILDELKNNIGFISCGVGNSIIEDPETHIFKGYQYPIKKGGKDKMSAFKNIVEECKANCPVIIGHSQDEVRLAEYVGSVGGFSIGINPKKGLANKFDIVMYSISWEPLVSLFDSLTVEK